MTWIDNKQWKYERDQQMKRVLIKTFSEKHRKMMTWTVVKEKYLQSFVNDMIQEGIIGEYGERYFPTDGLDFMKQLKKHFNGSRMVATDIIED